MFGRDYFANKFLEQSGFFNQGTVDRAEAMNFLKQGCVSGVASLTGMGDISAGVVAGACLYGIGDQAVQDTLDALGH